MSGFYLIKRTFGKSLYLNPFLNKKWVIDWDLEEQIKIKVSNKISEQDKEDYLFELYTGIDSGVNSWIQELKYIPRFINSALAFLVVYFFMSFVIRDPFPVIDELIAGAAAAVGIYFLTAARNRKSDIAMKKRIELKNQADQAAFIVDEKLLVLEELLLAYDEMSAVTLSDKICGDEGGITLLEKTEKTADIAEDVRILLHRNENHKKILRRLPSVNTEREITAMSAHLLNLAGRRKIDLPLLALYRSLTMDENSD
ncbi:MAG: hypothetical protein ISR78_04275 [Spirochaetia bacterium]|nr:hypothetical protein [Spirochaetia bacterium]